MTSNWPISWHPAYTTSRSAAPAVLATVDTSRLEPSIAELMLENHLLKKV